MEKGTLYSQKEINSLALIMIELQEKVSVHKSMLVLK
jgi:hypothetical protein